MESDRRRSFRFSSLLLTLTVLAAAAACTGSSSPLGTDGSGPEALTPSADTPTCVPLRDRGITQGQVCVSESGGEIVVQYTTTGGWLLRRTAAALGDDLTDFPTSSGRVDREKFPAQAVHEYVTSYTTRLSLAGSASRPGDTIYIAAWAAVVNGLNRWGAWAHGTYFPQGGGYYFEFVRPGATEPPPVPPPATQPLAFLVVGSVTGPTTSERLILTRLGNKGYDARMIDEGEFSLSRVAGCSVVIVAHSVSDAIGKRPKPLTCGLMISDDNSQGWHFQAFIDNDAYFDLAYWHRPDSLVYVIPGAPAALRAGLSGIVKFYTQRNELSWAPRADLPASAVRIANSRRSDYNFAIYSFEKGQPLADGTLAAGRRIFFGVHRDTFRLLTPQGIALWDAALAWVSS